MNDNPPNGPSQDQLSIRQRIDAICDQFQTAWNGPDRPHLESFLELVDDLRRGPLLSALVATELEIRRREFEEPEIDEYLQRFPDWQVEVETAFACRQLDETLGTPGSEVVTRAIRVRCPHCQSAVELSDGTEISEVVCASCLCSFTLVGDDSSAHRPTTGTRHGRRSLGHFELLKQIGAGAFGTVWQARDTKLDRIVAVKIPRKGLLDREDTEKFLREARATAQLNHPCIVNVHEIGIDDKLIYIVSDLVDGQTLSDVLAGRSLTVYEAARLCAKIAEALDYAHDQGVVHRDLKPGNIILDRDGQPHVMDFGLAKREAGEVTMTIEGQVLGTPAYMSPEQARGEGHQADRRSDIYSLGVILFTLLTGELPFRGSTRMLLKQVIEDEPPPLRKFNNRIPRDLETICLKCLEKSPSRRYATAAEVATELNRFLNGEPIEARPVGTLGRIWRWYRRHPDSSAQVAGVYTSFCALLLIAWGLEGLLVYGLGIDPSPDANAAMVETLGVLLFVYGPLMYAGLQIIRGRLWALWIGCLVSMMGLALVVAGLSGAINFSGVFADPRLRLGMLLLLGNLCIVGATVNAVALLSRLIVRES